MQARKRIKRGAIGLVGVASVILLGVGASWAIDRHMAAKPSVKNFEMAAAGLFDKRRHDDDDHGFRTEQATLCVPLPWYPEPDARPKVRYPLAWYMDFRAGEPSPARRGQLKQLDALSSVGLLSKVAVAPAGDATQPVSRYRLTSKGWAASNWKNQAPCLIYGHQHRPVVTGFERKQLPGLPNREWYQVAGTSGAGSLQDLVEWARSEEVRSAFPEIARQLAGVPFQMILTWDGKQWVDVQTFLQRQNSAQGHGDADARQQSEPPIDEATKRELAQLRKMSPPTVEEVKSILVGTYGDRQTRRSTLECIALPQAGSSRLPVDKELTPWNKGYGRYAVAIFTNKSRPAYDLVPKRTLPYLELLQALGVMTKRSQQGIPGDGAEAGKQFDADVYELAPPFAKAMDTELSHCLPLGKPTVEFVSVELSTRDEFGVPASYVRYKLRIRYESPPSWVKELPVAGWAEVQSALQHGRACDGRFHFDRRERALVAGGGSCWWAFDSYAESE
jgi:hypothetical protein